MSAERWFGKKTPPLVAASPVIADWRSDGTVRRSPFEDIAREPLHAEAETPTQAETSETASEAHELAMFPATYQAVTLRAGCPACVFITADGRPFARDYGFMQGIDWLKEGGREAFRIIYGGNAVEVRGRGLWPVFLALSEHRAYALHQFDPDTWQLPQSGPVVTHIAAKPRAE